MPGRSIPYLDEWDVLKTIAKFVVTYGHWPSVRQIKIHLGYFNERDMFAMLRNLIAVGVLEWEHDPKRNRHKARGIKLTVPILAPVKIAILPGTRCVEIHPSGEIVVDGKTANIVYVPNPPPGVWRDNMDAGGAE
jgi:hypothetical protein